MIFLSLSSFTSMFHNCHMLNSYIQFVRIPRQEIAFQECLTSTLFYVLIETKFCIFKQLFIHLIFNLIHIYLFL